MKTILMVAALTVGITSSAIAADFDTNTFSIEATSGVLDFSVDATENGLTDLAVGVTGFAHSFANLDVNIRGELSYNFDADTIGARTEYNVVTVLATNVTAYGSAALQYTTVETDLTDGDFALDPSVGVAYQVTNSVSVFGEVGYTWDMSNNWDRLGGYVEVGMPVVLSDAVTLTPSLIRGFDDGIEETNLNVTLILAF
jgi:opacity protein-like surface antigen